MTLDVRDPARERPPPLKLCDAIGEKRPSPRPHHANIKPQQQRPQQEDEDNEEDGSRSRSSHVGGLEAAMGRLSVTGSGAGGGEEAAALRRAVGAALARAAPAQLAELRAAPPARLPALLAAIARSTGEAGKEARANAEAAPRVPSKRRDPLEELRSSGGGGGDSDDLCPRSPMRFHQQHRNTFPYQNTSRRLHSGGCVSTVGVAGATPGHHLLHQQNHLHQQLQHNLAEVDGGLATPSDAVPGHPLGLGVVNNFSDVDRELLAEIVEQILHSPGPYAGDLDDLIPAPITELNAKHSDDGSSVFVASAADYSDESTSGCYSLSPTSVLSSSPGGMGGANGLPPMSPDPGHVVPDVGSAVVPDMSPSGHFFDDFSAVYRLDVSAKEHPRPPPYDEEPSPAYSGLCPSGHLPLEDFETRLQIASNDLLCQTHDVAFDPSDALLDFAAEPPPARSPTTTPYTPNIVEEPGAAPYGYPNDSLSLYGPPGGTGYNLAPLEYGGYPPEGAPAPSTVDVSALQLGVLMPVVPARVVPGGATPAPQLKQLKPKVEAAPARAETGRERILRRLDRDKKDQAWVMVTKHLAKMAARDADGDTQLMILCANPRGNENSVLEYTYALVENLKRTPGALSAVNEQGHSALYLAALFSGYAHRALMVRYIAEACIEAGEDVRHVTKEGNTMLHELCQQGDQRYDVLAELASLRTGDGRRYFDLDAENHEGMTPLHLAVAAHGVGGVSAVRSVQLLVSEGADVTRAGNRQGNTPLHLAVATSCSPALVEAALAGPAKSVLVNAFNLAHDTALHGAAARNDVQLDQQLRVVQLLLRHGAVKTQNAAGKFPIALVADDRRQIVRQRAYETRKAAPLGIA